MHEEATLLEPDDLLQLPDGESYELVDGRLKERTMGAKSNEVAGHLFGALYQHVRTRRLGHLFAAVTGFRCFPNRPRLVCKPDLAFVARGRFPDDRTPDGDVSLVPNLVAESISPNDTYEEVETKVNEYLGAGVQLVWIISPTSKTVIIRRPDKTAAMLDVTNTLSGEDVVPGFTCPIADLIV